MTDNLGLFGSLESSFELSGSVLVPDILTGDVKNPSGYKLQGDLFTTLLRGFSAYEIAVKNGFNGTESEWLQSLIGESVVIEIIKDTKDECILKFTVKDEEIITPNLKNKLIKGIDYFTEEEIKELVSAAKNSTIIETDKLYQPIGNYLTKIEALSNLELEDLLK